jgi:8-oxo-dGTP pyrophosphatase MutT (NUDIX family)
MESFAANAAALRAELETYQPTTPIESSHKDRMLSLLSKSTNPFTPLNFEPGHFTASAAIISPEAGRIAVIYNRHLDCWLQPGGHVEQSDVSTAATAVRETREELGLCLPLSEACILDLDVHDFPSVYGRPAHHHFDIRYLFWHPEAALTVSGDATAATWVTPAEAIRNARNEGLRRLFEKCTSAFSLKKGEA